MHLVFRMEGPVRLWSLLVLLVVQLVRHTNSFGFEDTLNEGSPCYDQLEDESDDLEKPLRCMPPFKNVISNAAVQVDPPQMTCGIQQAAQYCLQTGGYYRECQVCDAYDPGRVGTDKIKTELFSMYSCAAPQCQLPDRY